MILVSLLTRPVPGACVQLQAPTLLRTEHMCLLIGAAGPAFWPVVAASGEAVHTTVMRRSGVLSRCTLYYSYTLHKTGEVCRVLCTTTCTVGA